MRRPLVFVCLLSSLAAACSRGPADGPATLGLRLTGLSAEARRDLLLPDEVQGMRIASVDTGGPAAGAGIEPDDLLTAIDGTAVASPCAFARAMLGRKPGEALRLTVQRGGEALTLEVALANAFELYEGPCGAGEAWACFGLGRFYLEGDQGVPQDLDRAAELLDRACDGGSAAGCAGLGLLVRDRAGAEDPERAFELFTRACDDGDAAGCQNLAYQYALGLGVPKNDLQAAVLYRRACEQGDAIGCYNAGLMHEQGRGFLRDPINATADYQQGCDGGYALACTNLGYLYEHGTGVAKSEGTAVELYRRGCEGDGCSPGDPTGCFNMGVAHRDGLGGLSADGAAAVPWFERACDADSGMACANLANLYRDGDGVPADQNRAAELYRRACELGDEASCAV